MNKTNRYCFSFLTLRHFKQHLKDGTSIAVESRTQVVSVFNKYLPMQDN